jgi:acetolactate synthase-1/2/3 large subunit
VGHRGHCSCIPVRFGRIIADSLKSEHAKFLFGLPGGKSVDLYDALYETSEVRLIHVRHPASAAFMAYAHARLTGEPGVCHATVGPGAHNLVPGLAEAWSGCVPMVAVCPSVSLSHEGEGLIQEMPPQVPLFTSFTKWSARVTMPERIQWFIRRAFQIASAGKPGPVFLEFPSDYNDLEVDVPSYTPSIRPIRTSGDPDTIDRAIELLHRSERPVMLAGSGIYSSRTFEELREFAESVPIPVFTSCSGKGAMPEDHPLFAGMVGLYRTKVAKQFWEEADLVISIGSRFEELESAGWKWLPRNPKLIQIDIDPCEIGRNWVPQLAIVGDARLILQQMRSAISRRTTNQAHKTWANDLRKEKAHYEETMKSQFEDTSRPLKPLFVLKQMRKVFPRNTILCIEHGLSDNWAYPQFPILQAGSCVAPSGHTVMGLGVVGSIAAKLTAPERQVVSVTGDGAFQMYSDEVMTAKQYDAPVTWCVLNSFSLGWIKYDEHLAYGDRYIGVDFKEQPDFTKLADAYGCFGETVDSAEQVRDALQKAVEANNDGIPAILDFRVDSRFDAITEGFREYYGKH